MTDDLASIAIRRSREIFPYFTPAEVERLAPFGSTASYRPQAMVARSGTPSDGAIVVVSGELFVTQLDASGVRQELARHGPGQIQGEIAQLSGRPSLVDVRANSNVEALLFSTDQLHALLVGEAELGERIMRALILRRMLLLEQGIGGPVVIGSAQQAGVLRLTGFLDRNAHPYLHLDPDGEAIGRRLLEQKKLARSDCPVVLCPDGQVLVGPSNEELARCIGLIQPLNETIVHDVIVVGAGPAGLAASVYAASEGLNVLMLDCRSFGGQAGASARIENFLGFPTGISGVSLMARAFIQAQKFGVRSVIPAEASALCTRTPGEHRVTLANGQILRSRAVVIATGARYRQLPVPGLTAFEGVSLHYWASPLEAKVAAGQQVAVIGGGNSAGQAVVFLAAHAASVSLLARRRIDETMSSYLVERIRGLANVRVIEGCEVDAVEGEGSQISALCWMEGGSMRTKARLPVGQLFLFLGAVPNVEWLEGSGVMTDEHQFVLTEGELGNGAFPLETSQPGVFAIGDARANSIKRVAASAGDGARVVASLHAFLTRIDEASASPRSAA